MATDLETVEPSEASATSRPSLKIVGLHLRRLKSIDQLDLPADGMGWDGLFPDFVAIGGANGTGKTTILEFLTEIFTLLGRLSDDIRLIEIPQELQAEEARVDVLLSLPGLPQVEVQLMIGNEACLLSNGGTIWFGFQYQGQNRSLARARHSGPASAVLGISNVIHRVEKGQVGGLPAVVSFPSERRSLISPETDHKFPGKISERSVFVDRWRPPMAWADSLEARMYSVRWEDLNAIADGHREEANGFEHYARAFERFFEGRKRIKWTSRGDLVVETKEGVSHGLSDLSSGEKQIILFMSKLLHRWRTGSIILIDEPELHLHESFQSQLWLAILDWREERGGQVIIATQSDHLFKLAKAGTRVVLFERRR